MLLLWPIQAAEVPQGSAAPLPRTITSKIHCSFENENETDTDAAAAGAAASAAASAVAPGLATVITVVSRDAAAEAAAEAATEAAAAAAPAAAASVSISFSKLHLLFGVVVLFEQIEDLFLAGLEKLTEQFQVILILRPALSAFNSCLERPSFSTGI